jgi:hypothetical protein
MKLPIQASQKGSFYFLFMPTRTFGPRDRLGNRPPPPFSQARPPRGAEGFGVRRFLLRFPVRRSRPPKLRGNGHAERLGVRRPCPRFQLRRRRPPNSKGSRHCGAVFGLLRQPPNSWKKNRPKVWSTPIAIGVFASAEPSTGLVGGRSANRGLSFRLLRQSLACPRSPNPTPAGGKKTRPSEARSHRAERGQENCPPPPLSTPASPQDCEWGRAGRGSLEISALAHNSPWRRNPSPQERPQDKERRPTGPPSSAANAEPTPAPPANPPCCARAQ